MELKNYNTQTDDTLLKIGKIVADVLLGLECAFFLVFGIAGCVNSSLVYLIMVFLGPVFSIASWIFERILIAIGHDVKMMRNRIIGADTSVSTENNAASPALVQEPAASATTESSTVIATTEPSMTAPTTVQPTVGNKIFCMNCGTENDVDSKFCGKCGSKLS